MKIKGRKDTRSRDKAKITKESEQKDSPGRD